VDTCPICRSELAPEWKFCVHCGTPVVVADEPAATTAQPVTVADEPVWPPEPIPSAIRPETESVPAHRRLNARVVFGIAMGALGLAVVLYALVSILGSRG
jgi:hypothetical protein